MQKPLKPHFGLNANHHKLVYGIISAFAVMLLNFTIFLPQASAYSQTSYPPRCGVPEALNGWDYKAKIREVWPAFNPDTVQKDMIIAEVWGTNAAFPQTNFYFGDKLEFKTDDDANSAVFRSTSTSGTNWPFRDKFGNSNDSNYFMNFNFSSNPADTGTYRTLGLFSGTPVSNQTDVLMLTSYSPTHSAGSIKCIASAVNVNYHSSYLLPRYDALAVDNGIAITDSCDQSWSDPAEKVGCYMRKSIDSIGDAITAAANDAAKAIATVYAFLFIPDEGEVSNLIGATGTFFEEKLGFILYPFEFVIDLFAVFTDPPDDWCNSSYCTINAGTVFGAGSLQIDILAIKNLSEALWTLLTTLARIGLVMALIFGIHRKFDEVTQK